jgi:hypothetical protein
VRRHVTASSLFRRLDAGPYRVFAVLRGLFSIGACALDRGMKIRKMFFGDNGNGSCLEKRTGRVRIMHNTQANNRDVLP